MAGPDRKARRERRKRKSHRVQPAEALKMTVDTERQCEISTLTPTTTQPRTVRGNKDLRSPGTESNSPVPDFITQTDEYGNPITPRSKEALDSAKQDAITAQSESPVDPCETLLDSIRLMCCCLVPEDEAKVNGTKSKHIVPQATQSQSQSETSPVVSEDERDKPKLLPPIHRDDVGKKCLVLDLDETLVHSSFRAVSGADFVIPVQIEDVVHFVYVAKRPGVDDFLLEMAKHYEIVVYTASLNKYADPLLNLLDPQKVIRTRLFRESCVYHEGNYVKDLSLLDRDLTQSIIVDNSPNSYIFHPENAIDCSSFVGDPNDHELDQIGAFLAGIKDVPDVRGVAPRWREWPSISLESPEDDR